MTANLLLNEFTLFQNVSKEILEKIAAICERESFQAGEMVFREGEQADKLHFLISGSILLTVRLTSRPESITVSAVNQPYESFGWSGIVPPFHYTASAICEQDCQIMTIPGKPFMAILSENPEAGFFVMRRITELIALRLRNSRQSLLKTL